MSMQNDRVYASIMARKCDVGASHFLCTHPTFRHSNDDISGHLTMLTMLICISFKQASMLQQDWSSVNGNMTAYHLQSGTSCIGYQSDYGSSSRCVFLCTTACTKYHPAICPACVSQSLSTPAADAYDQLHVVTFSSVPATKTVLRLS